MHPSPRRYFLCQLLAVGGLVAAAHAHAWGGCAMFSRKHIAGPGWCVAWAKAPA